MIKNKPTDKKNPMTVDPKDELDEEDSGFIDKFKNFKLPKLNPRFKDTAALTHDERQFINRRISDSESNVNMLIEHIIITHKPSKQTYKIERVWYENHPLHFIMNHKEYKAKDEDDISQITTNMIFSILDEHNADINDVDISIVNDIVTKYI